MSATVVEAMVRAQIVADLAAAMPNEVVTDWEAGYVRGLKKAVQIVEDKK